jgi:hypothetical protein
VQSPNGRLSFIIKRKRLEAREVLMRCSKHSSSGEGSGAYSITQEL